MSVNVDSLIALAVDKQIPLEKFISFLENAVTEKYRELPDAYPLGRAVLNRDTGEMQIHAAQYDENGIYTHSIVHQPEGFNPDRIVRKEIKLRMRQQKDAEIVEQFTTNVGDVISGVVQQGREKDLIYVDLGRWEGVVPVHEQVPGEKFVHGQRIKAYVVDVKQGEKGPEITLSRTHPMLVKSLFALEVPELKSNIVEVMGVAREPGARTKISVRAHRAGVSPKGALIGPVGARSKAVSDELNGEKIDVVDFSDKLEVYVANALAPAKVLSSEVVDEETKAVKVVVPDYQLSLAIGKDGQNARLAARLTGAKIDIHPDNPVERIIKPSKIVEMEAKAKAAAQAEEEARLAAEEATKIEAANPEITQEPDSHLGEAAKDE
jgi:N utilization substance protein A